MPIDNAISNQLQQFGFPVVQAAPAAITAANPAVPAALSALVVNFTWTGNDPGLNAGTATIDDGVTVGFDNDAGDPLSVLQNEMNAARTDAIAARTEYVTYETAISALIVDAAALRTIIANVVTELTRVSLLVAS